MKTAGLAIVSSAAFPLASAKDGQTATDNPTSLLPDRL